jgi:hypothetical protein
VGRHLRGVPQVDLWLRENIGLSPKRFTDCAWSQQRTDADPLLAAALPKQFVAIVPADEARALAESVTRKPKTPCSRHSKPGAGPTPAKPTPSPPKLRTCSRPARNGGKNRRRRIPARTNLSRKPEG